VGDSNNSLSILHFEPPKPLTTCPVCAKSFVHLKKNKALYCDGNNHEVSFYYTRMQDSIVITDYSINREFVYSIGGNFYIVDSKNQRIIHQGYKEFFDFQAFYNHCKEIE
jgi:hypothetical protein